MRIRLQQTADSKLLRILKSVFMRFQKKHRLARYVKGLWLISSFKTAGKKRYSPPNMPRKVWESRFISISVWCCTISSERLFGSISTRLRKQARWTSCLWESLLINPSLPQKRSSAKTGMITAMMIFGKAWKKTVIWKPGLQRLTLLRRHS